MVKEPMNEDLSPDDFVRWVDWHGWTDIPPEYEAAIETRLSGDPIYYAGDVLARPIVEALLKGGEMDADSALEKMMNRALTEAYLIGHYHALAAAGIVLGDPQCCHQAVISNRPNP